MKTIIKLKEIVVTIVITDLCTNQVESYDVLDVDVMSATKRAIAIHFSSYNTKCNPNSYYIGKKMDTIWNEKLVTFAKKNQFSFTYNSKAFN